MDGAYKSRSATELAVPYTLSAKPPLLVRRGTYVCPTAYTRGEGEGGEVVTWASSTCTMTEGKQAAWATMLAAGGGHGHGDGTSIPSSSHAPAATLTGSDLVKGGETPVLLASDNLGRVGLLRYPAQLPPQQTEPPTADPATAPPKGEGGSVEEGAVGSGEPTATSPEDEEAAATAAAVMAQAIKAAVPRVRVYACVRVIVCLYTPVDGQRYGNRCSGLLPEIVFLPGSSLFLISSDVRGMVMNGSAKYQGQPCDVGMLRLKVPTHIVL